MLLASPGSFGADVAVDSAGSKDSIGQAIGMVRKGGRVVCGGIHMSDIPSFPYSLLWEERHVMSVANLTRSDAHEFLALAPKAGVHCEVTRYPLARANEAPGRGFHWGMATFHPTLPRGARVHTAQNGTLEEILVGPARENDGTFNLMGGLRTSMATCGYEDIAEFNRAELMVAPSLQTEGKQLQREQQVGMGSNGKAAAVLVND